METQSYHEEEPQLPHSIEAAEMVDVGTIETADFIEHFDVALKDIEPDFQPLYMQQLAANARSRQAHLRAEFGYGVSDQAQNESERRYEFFSSVHAAFAIARKVKRRYPSYGQHPSSRYEIERLAFKSLEEMVDEGVETDYDELETRLVEKLSNKGGMVGRMVEKQKDVDSSQSPLQPENSQPSDLENSVQASEKAPDDARPLDFLEQIRANPDLRNQVANKVNLASARTLTRVTRNHTYLYGQLSTWAKQGEQKLREDTQQKVIVSLKNIATSLNEQHPGTIIIGLTGSKTNFSLLYNALDPSKHPREALLEESENGDVGIDDEKKEQLQETWERLRRFGHMLDVE